MASNLGRVTHLETLITWLDTNFSVGAKKPINRSEIAQESGVAVDYVNKAMLVLVQNGYVYYERHRNDKDIHGLLKPISEVTGQMLHEWITAYQVKHDQVRRANLKQQAELLQKPLITPEPKGYSFALETVISKESDQRQDEPQPEPVKSRSQQLLEEAQRLQQLAEEEAQREAKEAEQTTGQPGTLPELLELLDTRIDGIEHKFNALEKKVNVVLYFFQQASFAVRSLGPVSLPVEPIETPQPVAETAPPPAEPTTRMLLVRLVNSYAAADRKTERETWKWLYGQYDLRKGFNVYTQAGPQAKGNDESYLAVIEQHGHIDDLYKMAKKLMVLPDLR